MMYDEQMLVGESSEKWWSLYKYWPQGLFAGIFHQLLSVDSRNIMKLMEYSGELTLRESATYLYKGHQIPH